MASTLPLPRKDSHILEKPCLAMAPTSIFIAFLHPSQEAKGQWTI